MPNIDTKIWFQGSYINFYVWKYKEKLTIEDWTHCLINFYTSQNQSSKNEQNCFSDYANGHNVPL